MALQEETLDLAHRYWADRLGCSPADLRDGDDLRFIESDDGVDGIAILDRKTTRVVSAGPDRIDDLRDRTDTIRDLEPTGEGEVAEALGIPIRSVLGPQFIGYVDDSTFRPAHDANARVLDADDRDAFEALKRACPREEWEGQAGDLAFETHLRLAGRFLGDDLAAVAGYREIAVGLVTADVITHPDHRNRGFGTGAASAAIIEALAAGYAVDCRPVESWETAVDIAQFLGFERYARAWRILPM
ncbi:MAG: hypothetical protein ABEJ71_01190 [Halodesulfurarchaeum sp.]